MLLNNARYISLSALMTPETAPNKKPKKAIEEFLGMFDDPNTVLGLTSHRLITIDSILKAEEFAGVDIPKTLSKNLLRIFSGNPEVFVDLKS